MVSSPPSSSLSPLPDSGSRSVPEPSVAPPAVSLAAVAEDGTTAFFRFIDDKDGKHLAGDAFEVATFDPPLQSLVRSEPAPVVAQTRYRFGAWVRAVVGTHRYGLDLEWLDAEGESLGFVNSWMGIVAGPDWEPHFVETIAPAAARTARMRLFFAGNHSMLVRGATIEQLPGRAADLSVDLLAAPDRLTVRLESRGELVLTNLRGRIELPEGLTTRDATTFRVETLTFEDSFTATLALEGAPTDFDAPIRCRVEADAEGEAVAFDAATLPNVTVATEIPATAADLPDPVLPEMPVRLGAYYFPVMLDWDRGGFGVRRVDSLNPKLGYYDEASPEVADWHIYWAVEHGVSFFVFDYYYNNGMFYINDALERGFLGSRFADKMQFCLDWCNEGHCAEFRPLDFSHRALADFTHILCERYFLRDNYLKVDGRPVLLIHQWERIVNAHGGWTGCRDALNRMRDVARQHGLPGIYFVAVLTNTPWLMRFEDGGFDAVTAYAYGFRDVKWGGPDRSLPYQALIPRHRECFETAGRLARQQGLDYIPTAWVGWDDIARSRERSVRTAGNTPDAFRRMIEMLPDHTGTEKRLALFESWNEWGEGGHAEPEELLGFGRLSAIRDVVTAARGPYSIHVPTPEEVARFDTPITHRGVNDMYYDRYARSIGLENGFRMEFDSDADLWLRPAQHIRFSKMNEGVFVGEAFGGDPVLHGPPAMRLDAERFPVVRVRMRVDAGRQGELYWTTTTARGWHPERSVAFDLIPDGEFHDYELDMTGHPEWTGEIWQFRFDPMDAAGHFGLDWFDITPRD